MDTTKQTDAAAEMVDPRYPKTPIGIVRSRDAFLRDLPALLANPKYDRWSVAYFGDERVALAESQLDVIRACVRRGLHSEQYYIGCIFPHSDEEEEEIDTGFCEFEEIDDDDADASPNASKLNP